MNRRLLACFAVFLPAVLFTLSGLAQQLEPAPLPAEALVQGQAMGEEPTLPEVVVEPPEQPAPAPATSAQESSSNPFDLPLSYPNLDQIEMEGYASVLRSTRSIFDDPRPISVVDRQDLIERQPRDMIEALEREVSVLMQRTGRGQASPFVRGLTGPQTLILVDGIRLNNSAFRFGPNQYFATIDPGMIERIEVVRGPQSVLWGSDAIGGVINVVTRSADIRFHDYLGGEFVERFSTADAGSYSRANVKGSLRNMGVFGGASYLNVNNLDRGGGLDIQPFTDYDQYAGDIKVDYLIDRDQMLTVSLQHLQQNRVPRTDKFPDSARRFDPQQRDLGYLRWQGTDPGGLIDSWMITGSYNQMRERAKRRDLGATREDIGEFTVGTTGINLTLGTEIGWAGRLTYGADWYHDEVESWKFRFFDDGTVESRTPQFPDDAYYERVAGFLQWEVDITQRLMAVTGVRYTNIDTGATVANFDTTDPNFPNVDPVQTPLHSSFQDWTASVGLTYELTRQLHLVGTVAEGFRAPNLDELTTVSDNVFDNGVDLPSTGLNPEQSISYEVGVKLNYDRLRGQIFYFWNDLTDLSQRVLVSSVGGVDYYRRENVGSAVVQGFEMAGEYLLTPRWAAYGNFWTIYGQNLTDNEPLRRIPPTQGVLGLRWRDRKARNWFELYSWLVAKQDRLSSGDISDSRIPPGGTPGYGIVSARIGRYIGCHQRVVLGIDNIFDKAYRVHGSGVDGPGISGVFSYELIY